MNGQGCLGPGELIVRIWMPPSTQSRELGKKGTPRGGQGTEAPEITRAFSGGGMGTSVRLSAGNSPSSQKGSLYGKGKT